ncbi:MAG: fluoride efflux transporter CrcB [Actinobacteria bacterium]|nr:fluoride efflux transporter CrcB [Actinomycetota bacterium]
MKLVDIMIVVLGAGIGGGARYAIGGWITNNLSTSFPWHTLAINISGAFLLGLLMALSIDRGVVPGSWRLFLGTGVLGGFTTFSTLSYESVALIEQGLFVQGAGNMLGTAVIGILAAIVGLAVGRAI